MAKTDFNAIKKELKSKLPDYLGELGIDTSKKFNCINPYHDDKNPSMGLDTKNGSTSVHCFGCGVSWDIFDLYAVETEQGTVNSDGTVTYDYKKIFHELATKYGINLPEYKPSQEDQLDQKVSEMAQYTIQVAQAHLDETDYLKKRGISMELAKRFHLGYVSTWDNPKAALQGKKITPTPRVIIPTSENTYLARDARLEIPDAEQPYKKQKVGTVHLFNGKALLQDTKPIFLVEGEFDALSIMEASDKVEAVALGSTTNQKKLIDTLKAIQRRYEAKNRLYDPQFLIAMDNDSAGELANHQLEKKLQGLGFDNCHIVTKSLLGSYKDANEALVKDRARLQKRLENVLKDPDQYLINLLKRIQENMTQQRFIPTGFDNLDRVLDGGLYPQLYVIGAVSSLGKTTFTLQIADNIAKQKRPVFFFSLETSRDTLTEKIISRHTFEQATLECDYKLAQNARSIDNGYFFESDEGGIKHKKVFDSVMRAFDSFANYYQYLKINNGITNRPSAQDIYNKVARYCTKNPDIEPVVIVDYLQILKPLEKGLTDKEAVTASVAKLNELTEEFHAPVILISSFNRQSYDKEVAFDSFKESGEIEYYSDVLMGLQYQKDKTPDFTTVEDPLTPREVEVVILKNRNGASHKKVQFNFYNAYNMFEAQSPDEAMKTREKILKTLDRRINGNNDEADKGIKHIQETLADATAKRKQENNPLFVTDYSKINAKEVKRLEKKLVTFLGNEVTVKRGANEFNTSLDSWNSMSDEEKLKILKGQVKKIVQDSKKLIDTLENMNCILFDIKAELEAVNANQRKKNELLDRFLDHAEETNAKKINVLQERQNERYKKDYPLRR